MDGDDHIKSPGNRYSAPALSKGIDIIELLSDTSEGLSLKELSDALGRTVSELFRMVVVLEERGYVAVTGSGRYMLTLRLFEIAQRFPPLKSLIQISLPEMRRLSLKTMQSCHLSVYHAGRMMVVAQVEGPERWTFGLKVGSQMELTETASGMAALALQPADVEARMLAEDNLLPRPRPRNLAQVRRDIETTRVSGYCVMPSRQVAGVTNIAAPILGYGGYAVAVIAVPHIQRIDLIVTPPPDALLVHVCDVAGNLSRLSGHIAETRATPPTSN